MTIKMNEERHVIVGVARVTVSDLCLLFTSNGACKVDNFNQRFLVIFFVFLVSEREKRK